MKKLKLDLLSEVRSLEILTKGLVNTKFIGDYKSIFKGRGLEFKEYRQYNPTDDASMIDWKATVRSDKVLVKEFMEERNLNVFFLIDASSSMILGSIPKLKSEYVAELVASLSYAILLAGDNIGCALFSNKVVKNMPLTEGLKQFYKLSEILVDVGNYGGAFNLSEAFTFLLNTIKEYSIVIIVSDFLPLTTEWVINLEIASKKFEIIGIMVRDPRDQTLPGGIGRAIVSDPFSKSKLLIEPDKIKEEYAKEAKKDEEYVRTVFVRNNCDFLKLSTDKPFIEPLTDLFRRRSKKWR